ncbi:hypothetical protein BDR03DRAFT_1059223 [Suillus americanus]|nr:hypothetical protein BDR03DRAFT_1059223 [Suillus americanus]
MTFGMESSHDLWIYEEMLMWHVVEPQANSQGKGKGNASPSSRKEAARWTVEEEAAFLNVLYQNKLGTDGMNFPKVTCSKAVQTLAEKFEDQKGGEKNESACKTKFRVLKSAYHVAVDLRFGGSLSGFTWTDDGGACIDDSSASTWAGYVKSHLNTKQFQSKGFPHFAIFDLLAAGEAVKGVHVHQVRRKKATSTSSGTTGLNLRELSVAANEISVNMATTSGNVHIT